MIFIQKTELFWGGKTSLSILALSVEFLIHIQGYMNFVNCIEQHKTTKSSAIIRNSKKPVETMGRTVSGEA
jgi:hypothetical protein